MPLLLRTKHFSSWLRRVTTTTLLVLGTSRAFAVDPAQGVDRLLHTAWGSREGAPGDIHFIRQTPDGFLWLGSPSGLTRFDGVNFQHYQSRPGEPILDFEIGAMSVDHAGAIWLASRPGDVYRIQGGAIKVWRRGVDLPFGDVGAFAQDAGGRIWIGKANKLFMFDHERWQPAPLDLPRWCRTRRTRPARRSAG